VLKKSILPDFHARHPGAPQGYFLRGKSRGPARLSDFFNEYLRKVLDSGLRRNDGLADVYPLIHSL
jgi:hypothetical protein